MTTQMILTVIGLLTTAVYVVYTMRFARGLQRLKSATSYEKPTVSVVVAARNESRNIQMLLTSLVNQSYPPELFEIIIADDQSTDDTREKIAAFSEKWSNVRCIEVKDRDKAKSPKKNALSQAIAAGTGEIILTTDADCVAARFWIESMVACFEEGVDMVAGYSRPKIVNWKDTLFIQRYEYFDVFVLFSAAAGAIGEGKAFSCSGQNLAYRRQAFDTVCGFSHISHLVSGDDVNLMQLMRIAGKKIKYAVNAHTFVYTRPIESMSSFFNQRARWASNLKVQIGLNTEFFLYLVAVAAMHALSVMMIFYDWRVAVLIWAARLIAEFRFLMVAKERFLIESDRFRFYPIWFLLQPLYIVMTALRGALSVYKWHGR